MLLKSFEQRVRKAFSDSAIQYEVFSQLQKEIGRELSQKIISLNQVDPSIRTTAMAVGLTQDSAPRVEKKGTTGMPVGLHYILDIGMGTGWFTNRLSFLFPDSLVIGLDFATGMVKFAKRKYEELKVIQADAGHLPFKENSFDVITSNLAYQWVLDLKEAFKDTFRILKPKGTICLTMFGYESLKEMYNCLEQTRPYQNQRIIPFKRLPSLEELILSLESSGFQNIELNREILKVHFMDLFELIFWLKKIGANTSYQNIFIGHNWLKSANEYYKKHFASRFGIDASFEIFWVKAEKEKP